MGRVEIKADRCKGCLLCTTVCPQEILQQSEKMNAKGYKYVCIVPNAEKECKGCAFCAEICPDCAIIVFKEKNEKTKS